MHSTPSYPSYIIPYTYLVDSAEGGDVHSLPAHHTRRTHTGTVFAGAAVDDGVHNNLDTGMGEEMWYGV